MKIKTRSKVRAAQRPRYRVVYESDYDHPAWHSDGPDPTLQSEPDAFYVSREPLTPAAEPPSTRQAPHESLSIGALRKRLYRAGVRSPRLNELAREIAAGLKVGEVKDIQLNGGWVMGWPVDVLKQRFGQRIARAVTHFVLRRFLLLDEFWSGFSGEPAPFRFLEGMQAMRKFAPTMIEVTQSIDQLESQAAHAR